jgi:hypothetical protein
MHNGMVHEGVLAVAILMGAAGLALAFFSQRYWFARVWEHARGLRSPFWRRGGQCAILAVTAVLALLALRAILANLRGSLSHGWWWTAFFGLWLASSIVAYLFVKMAAGAKGIRRRFRAKPFASSPVAAGSAAKPEAVDHSRRYFFRTAGLLAGIECLVRREIPNLLLSHNPNSFPRAAELGIELSLAGHTHGGQVRVEILDHRWSPAQYLTPYIAGLFRRPMLGPAELTDSQVFSRYAGRPLSYVYVNRGLGTIGAPIRFGVPPEITLLTLRRA